MNVLVVCSPAARQVLQWPLVLPAGADVRQAIQASAAAQAMPGLDLAHCAVGIWGRKVAWDQPLRDGDRVEVYRALRVDPKVARRERFRKQGARAAGLFAGRRPQSKPGY